MGKKFSGNLPNLKKTLVAEIYEKELYPYIMAYRSFLTVEFCRSLAEITCFQSEDLIINARVKTPNSIEDKIRRYSEKDGGRFPINKCFNDLMGLRVIYPHSDSAAEIGSFLFDHGVHMKCRDSSNREYVATHLYFHCGNEVFPWELQIWPKEPEQGNLNSHKEYKQDYTQWEAKSKGGV